MKLWGVLLLALLAGCTSQTDNRFEHAQINVNLPVQYTPTGIDGYVSSNQELCNQDGKIIMMLFGKEDNVWSEEALRIAMEAVKPYSNKIFFEDWSVSAPSDRQELFAQFNPSKSTPTIIVGCKYVKVGSSGNKEQNIAELKQILGLATS